MLLDELFEAREINCPEKSWLFIPFTAASIFLAAQRLRWHLAELALGTIIPYQIPDNVPDTKWLVVWQPPLYNFTQWQNICKLRLAQTNWTQRRFCRLDNKHFCLENKELRTGIVTSQNYRYGQNISWLWKASGQLRNKSFESSPSLQPPKNLWPSKQQCYFCPRKTNMVEVTKKIALLRLIKTHRQRLKFEANRLLPCITNISRLITLRCCTQLR